MLWREDKGMWFDYDIKNMMNRLYFYITNFTPLWTLSYPKARAQVVLQKVLEYTRETGLEQYLGKHKQDLLSNKCMF